jgi:hypothetical protein
MIRISENANVLLYIYFTYYFTGSIVVQNKIPSYR